jgi:large exoprotein involved in heme utilization and adhesion
MRARAGAAGLAAASVLLAVGSAHAQVVTDGSLGPAVALSGPGYVIDQSLRQTRGANLFHSFSTFNLGSGDFAAFFADPGVVNIIARVTGGFRRLLARI